MIWKIRGYNQKGKEDLPYDLSAVIESLIKTVFLLPYCWVYSFQMVLRYYQQCKVI